MSIRIGLFGGSFNPVHIGHLRAAEEIKELLMLDKVIFIPTAVHPLKRSKNIPEGRKRFQMLKLATRDNPDFEVSDLELKRKGPSYTIDTLKYFSKKYKRREFYFILGSENLYGIDKWKDYSELFEYSNFAIMKRPGVRSIKGKSAIPSKLRKMFVFKQPKNDIAYFQHKSSKKLIFLNIRGIRISSTKVRKLIRDKKSVRYFIPNRLYTYIMKNNLYTGE